MFAMLEGVLPCNPLINIDSKELLEKSVMPNYFSEFARSA